MPRIIIEFDTMEDAENAYEDVYQATMQRNPINSPIITIEETNLDIKLALALENILYGNVIEGSDKIQAEQALNDYYKN